MLQCGLQARDTFKALDRSSLRVDLNISLADLGETKDHPIIKPTDFLRAMDENRRLDLLLPAENIELSKPILQEYWRRFADQFGRSHDVFSKVLPQDLALTIPCKVHGDEGRSSSI